MLLVEAVLGVKCWRDNDISCLAQPAKSNQDIISPFLDGSFKKDNMSWSIFSLDRLFNDNNFRTATLV